MLGVFQSANKRCAVNETNYFSMGKKYYNSWSVWVSACLLVESRRKVEKESHETYAHIQHQQRPREYYFVFWVFIIFLILVPPILVRVKNVHILIGSNLGNKSKINSCLTRIVMTTDYHRFYQRMQSLVGSGNSGLTHIIIFTWIILSYFFFLEINLSLYLEFWRRKKSFSAFRSNLCNTVGITRFVVHEASQVQAQSPPPSRSLSPSIVLSLSLLHTLRIYCINIYIHPSLQIGKKRQNMLRFLTHKLKTQSLNEVDNSFQHKVGF